VKNIGKPCAGKPHARFDEGGLVKATTARLFRHRRTKGAETDKPNLKPRRSALYSTLAHVFGYSDGADFTWFGQALFDKGLRRSHSFVDAFERAAAAREAGRRNAVPPVAVRRAGHP
jgi:hypothetical protein